MFENLEAFSKRQAELMQKMADPSVLSDPNQYASLMKEYRELSPIVEKYEQYRRLEREFEEAKELFESSSGDKDMRELAAEEMQTAGEEKQSCAEELKWMLLPKDPNDEKNVIVEIRAGAGGEEAALFASVLFRMYSMYAQRKGWTVELLNWNETELGGYKEMSFSVSGAGAYSRLKYESGVHRVQRVPETETQGRIHTSTATVAVLRKWMMWKLPLTRKICGLIRSAPAGPAGSTSIRRPLPFALPICRPVWWWNARMREASTKTKIRPCACFAPGCMKKNRLLRIRLLPASGALRWARVIVRERIRTYNYPQGRVTDHRIGLTIYRLEDFLNGNLDEIIDALTAADRTRQLQEASEPSV